MLFVRTGVYAFIAGVSLAVRDGVPDCQNVALVLRFSGESAPARARESSNAPALCGLAGDGVLLVFAEHVCALLWLTLEGTSACIVAWLLLCPAVPELVLPGDDEPNSEMLVSSDRPALVKLFSCLGWMVWCSDTE
jgi:hypothetical protein